MATPKNISRIPLLLFSILLLLLTACGDNNSDKPESFEKFLKPKTETFEATTQENTAAVSASVIKSLDSYDAKTGTYVFSDNADEVEDLKPGTVVLFETHSLRKIKSVKKEGRKIVVTSEYARLTDYYKDAKISYETPVNWNDFQSSSIGMNIGQPIATMATPMMSLISPQDGEIEAGETEGSNVVLQREINGWKIKFELNPVAGSRLNIKLSATKGNVCSITAEGFISSFTSNADVVIEGGATQHVSYNNNGMQGEMEVKFAAVGLGSEIAILEIPASIERTILVNGIIPVTLRLKANLKIYPEVAAGSSSQVSMKLTYDSNIGFSYEAGRVTSRGEVTGDNARQTGDSNTATAGIAGMGVGVEFPRMEVGILGNTIVPYILLNTHTSSYLSTGLLDNRPCHTATCKYEVHVGVSLNFLGIASVNHDYKAFEEEKRWVAEGSHCGD
ncbi:hypothetical protein ATE92_2773 [Ulvibacter sp. MAR_2010_11]|uniref:hypothetical protein n=1 Tax=Ulvibacter sp. MAR_2010_11 TaxID=1250229 RepID=UPI000C2CD85D|nr:hypothetical protein [Ulvibacter sp. MAR_2010_11]PKA84576.1 hypothetical protein ATE92_2773 [Ulvibacter sp. MAR_2010_11]